MGTRGVFGFHKDGVDKIMYNHYDSYPTDLGEQVQEFIKKHNVGELDIIFDRIVMIGGDNIPNLIQIEECEPYTDLSVSSKSTADWYCLLRKAQGDLEAYADGLKYMIEGADFLKDSLFCEWGYVINLTTRRLEIYRGFQKKPQENRYKVMKSEGGYFNCALIREVPLTQVKNFDMQKFEDEISQSEES
jgi:hypothetical protein